MCSGSKNRLDNSDTSMAGASPNGVVPCKCSVLLELAASDDPTAFKYEVEGRGCDVDEPCFWYGGIIGSRKMGFEERTPLMIAAMFGSLRVMKYILGTGKADVNRACGSDKVTALHCAVVGGSRGSLEAVKLLIDSGADSDCLDANGNKPVDLIGLVFKLSGRKNLKLLFKDEGFDGEGKLVMATLSLPEKKEYPTDVPLPDINNGIYSSDEFRMYTFKVKPCSRAYSHDWTECPFVHPGENARRRDPRKYPYSCVPCPDFRKGSCPKGDSCEYAHGVFESWLHPAQYKTRLCKDETGCARKVCFFAHKPEELRPVYASTGSALPSPRSFSPPSSPMASPKSMGLWHSPPALQLSGSRLKTGLTARDFDVELEILGLENNQLLEEFSRLSSPSYSRIGDMKPVNFEDSLRTLDPMSQLQGFPMNNGGPHSPAHTQSSMGLQMRQNMSQLRHGNNFPSSAVATAVMNSRSAAMTKRSQSFIDRGSSSSQGPYGQPASPMAQSNISGWGSPDGRLDWGVRGDDLHKLRKSYSFGIRDTSSSAVRADFADEPDVSWVNSLVRDVPQGEHGMDNSRNGNGSGPENHSVALPWGVDQLYIEQEQIVA